MSVEIPRDRYGRPQIPDPFTGKSRAWTRVTTLASTIADRYGLEKWMQRELVRGMAIRGDKLMVQAVAAGDDRKALERIIESALEAAQTSSSAEVGSALHLLAERIDGGEKVDVPPAYKPDIDAYIGAMSSNGVEVVDGWIERFVVIPSVSAAGTADRLVTVDGFLLPLIADIKTGSDPLKYGAVEIAAQLATYSRASHWWDGKEHHEMPKVDQDWGIVAHMPAGQGRCELHLIDLQRGWDIAMLCYQARETRKGKGLTRPLVAPTAEETNNDNPPDDTADDDLKARIKDIVRALEGAPLPVPWPAGVTPPKKADGWTAAERAKIVKWCDKCAPKTTEVPF